MFDAIDVVQLVSNLDVDGRMDDLGNVHFDRDCAFDRGEMTSKAGKMMLEGIKARVAALRNAGSPEILNMRQMYSIAHRAFKKAPRDEHVNDIVRDLVEFKFLKREGRCGSPNAQYILGPTLVGGSATQVGRNAFRS